MSSISSMSDFSESKLNKIRKLVDAIELYLQTKREDTAILINMYLQSLSVTIDLSIFDPQSSAASQFYVSLYELMNKMEQNSTFAWNCVDILANACRNPSARHALIHTYQFIPSLSRMLGNHLSLERKICLLRLMQDLTSGIKISWQIPHLAHLMVTLTQWIEECEEERIVTLAVGILANLCYKNLPAVYTLMGNVDVKTIIDTCFKIKGPTVEIHTYKLLMIVDDNLNGGIPEAVLSKITNVTFDSITEAFVTGDSILLRQVFEFFQDVAKQNPLETLENDAEVYEQKFQTLFQMIEKSDRWESGDEVAWNPECLALVFDFWRMLSEISFPQIEGHYRIFLKYALKWIHTEMVSSQALGLLKTVAIRVDPSDIELLASLAQGLPIFLNSLNFARTEANVVYSELNKNNSAVLQLLKVMVQVESIKQKVLDALRVEKIAKVFGALLTDECPMEDGAKDQDMGNLETINLYAHGVALVMVLAREDERWIGLQDKLLQHKQIQMVLAQCLYESSKEMKSIVLEISLFPHFPRQMIAEAMASLQPLSIGQDSSNKSSYQSLHEMSSPVMSVSQLGRIDTIIAKFEEIFASRQESSIVTSDVIELYEYKLAAMGNSERSALASVEAASEQCAHLQHRNAQMTCEVNRLHQLLFHVQQCSDEAVKSKELMAKTLEQLQEEHDANADNVKMLSNRVNATERELASTTQELFELKEKHGEIVEEVQLLRVENNELKTVNIELEENCGKLQKALEKKEEGLQLSKDLINQLNLTIQELGNNLLQREAELHNKNLELQIASQELVAKKKVLETITKYASSSNISSGSGR